MKYKLGIVIPYYKNSEECEKAFKQLLEKLNKQLKENALLSFSNNCLNAFSHSSLFL